MAAPMRKIPAVQITSLFHVFGRVTRVLIRNNHTIRIRDKFIVPNPDALRWFPGHMKKGLDRIQSLLRDVDGIIEVHDSRIPLSGRHPQLRDILNLRPYSVILSKSDLLDTSNDMEARITQQLKKGGVDNVHFCECTDTGRTLRAQIKKEIVPTLIENINNRPRYRKNIRNDYYFMIIGVPNVGKSSIINKLRYTFLPKRGNVAQVGALPGVTRGVGNRVRVSLEPEMFVFDTPGILSPKILNVESGMKLALCGCLPEHLVGEELIVDYLLYWLNKHKKFTYMEVYKMGKPTDNVLDFLAHVSLLRKFVYKDRQNPNVYRPNFTVASTSVIRDFQQGVLGKVMLDMDLIKG